MKVIHNKVWIVAGAVVFVVGGIVLAKDSIMMKISPEAYLMQAIEETRKIIEKENNTQGILKNIEFLNVQEGIVQEIDLKKKASTGMGYLDEMDLKYKLDIETLPTELAMDMCMEIGEEIFDFKGYICKDQIGINLSGMNDTYLYANGKTFSKDFNAWEVTQQCGLNHLPSSLNWDGLEQIKEDEYVVNIGQCFKEWYETNKEDITIETKEPVHKAGKKYNVISVQIDEDVVEDGLKEILDTIEEQMEEVIIAEYISHGYDVQSAKQASDEEFRQIKSELGNIDYHKGLEIECLIDSKERICEMIAEMELSTEYEEIELETDISFEGEKLMTDIVNMQLEMTVDGEKATVYSEYERNKTDKGAVEEELEVGVDVVNEKMIEMTFKNTTKKGDDNNTTLVEGSIELYADNEGEIIADYEADINVDKAKQVVVAQIESLDIDIMQRDSTAELVLEGEYMVTPLAKETVKPRNTKSLFELTLPEVEVLMEDIFY